MLDKKKIKELEQKLETISEEMLALEDTKLATEKELDRLSRDTSIELPEPGTMFYSVLDSGEIFEYEYDREYSDSAYLLGRLFETEDEAHKDDYDLAKDYHTRQTQHKKVRRMLVILTCALITLCVIGIGLFIADAYLAPDINFLEYLGGIDK